MRSPRTTEDLPALHTNLDGEASLYIMDDVEGHPPVGRKPVDIASLVNAFQDNYRAFISDRGIVRDGEADGVGIFRGVIYATRAALRPPVFSVFLVAHMDPDPLPTVSGRA